MILAWLGFCFLFTLVFSGLFIWPIARHSSLPQRKKWLLSMIIFMVLVPGGMALYSLLGMPPMVLF